MKTKCTLFILLFLFVQTPNFLRAQCAAGYSYLGTSGNSINLVNISTWGNNNYIFHWDFGDGNFIETDTTGITSNPLMFHGYTASGNYYVCLSLLDINPPHLPCSEYCDTISVSISGSGTEDIESGYLSIYPNPVVDGKIICELATPIERVEVVGNDGSILMAVDGKLTHSLVLDLTTINKGMYYMRVMSDGKTYFRKIIR